MIASVNEKKSDGMVFHVSLKQKTVHIVHILGIRLKIPNH